MNKLTPRAFCGAEMIARQHKVGDMFDHIIKGMVANTITITGIDSRYIRSITDHGTTLATKPEDFKRYLSSGTLIPNPTKRKGK